MVDPIGAGLTVGTLCGVACFTSHFALAAWTASATRCPAWPQPITHRCDQPHVTGPCCQFGGTSVFLARATPINPSERACVSARCTVRTEQPTFSAILRRKAQHSLKLATVPITSDRRGDMPAVRARWYPARASVWTGPSQSEPDPVTHTPQGSDRSCNTARTPPALGSASRAVASGVGRARPRPRFGWPLPAPRSRRAGQKDLAGVGAVAVLGGLVRCGADTPW